MPASLLTCVEDIQVQCMGTWNLAQYWLRGALCDTTSGVTPGAQSGISYQVQSLHVNCIALLPAIREKGAKSHRSDASQQL